MREFQKKKTIKAIFCSRYMLLVYVLLIVFMANAVYGSYGKYKQGKALESTANRELDTLLERKNYLESHVQSIGRDGGEEKEVLDRFSMVKPGEHLIILVGKDVVTKELDQANQNWFGKIWNFFAGN